MNVLITGASSGIGKSLVALYCSKGAKVLACGRNFQKLDDLKTEYPTIETFCFDITSPIEVQQHLANVSQLDIAILNAGDCEYIDDVMNFDAAAFQRVIEVNLISLGSILQTILPKLRTASTLALMGSSVTYLPFPKAHAYGASKAGVDYLSQTLRLELAPKGINVSLIQPGFIETPLTDKNDFAMPFLMTSDEAAIRIYKGLSANKQVICFPKRFIYLMKLISLLPQKLWANVVLKDA